MPATGVIIQSYTAGTEALTNNSIGDIGFGIDRSSASAFVASANYIPTGIEVEVDNVSGVLSGNTYIEIWTNVSNIPSTLIANATLNVADPVGAGYIGSDFASAVAVLTSGVQYWIVCRTSSTTKNWKPKGTTTAGITDGVKSAVGVYPNYDVDWDDGDDANASFNFKIYGNLQVPVPVASLTLTGQVPASTKTVPIPVAGGAAGTPAAYFGHTSVPADNGDNPGPTVTFVPPASMLEGDEVNMLVGYKSTTTSNTLDITDAGGQTWDTGPMNYAGAANMISRWFRCKFNGTWSANPIVTYSLGGTANMSGIMIVFRNVNQTTALDVAESRGTVAAPGSPFDMAAVGPITTTDNAMAVIAWFVADDATCAIQTAGWSNPNSETQWRNTNGGDSSFSIGYKSITPLGDTGTVNNRQSIVTGDAFNYHAWALATEPAAAGGLVLTGQVPTSQIGLSTSVPAAALTLTGQVSTLTRGVNIPSSPLVLTSFVPQVPDPVSLLPPASSPAKSSLKFKIEVATEDGTKIGEIMQYQNLTYRKVINSVGSAVMTLPRNTAIAQLMWPSDGSHTPNNYRIIITRVITVVDPFTGVSTVTSNVDWIGFVQGWSVGRNPEGTRNTDAVTVSCVHVNSLLRDRLILTTDLFSGGQINSGRTEAFNIKTGPAETVWKDYVDECLVSGTALSWRVYPGLTTATDLNRGTTIAFAGQFDNLLEALNLMSEYATLDFDIINPSEDGYNFQFEVYSPIRGVDRSIGNGVNTEAIFSFDREGNLITGNYSLESIDRPNALFMLGQGELSNRTVLYLTDSAQVNSWGLREFVVDGRDTDTIGQELTRAQGELAQHVPAESINFGIPNLPSWVYGVHWDFGDIVSIQIPEWGVDTEKQIRAIQVSVSSGEVPAYSVEIGDPKPSLVRRLRSIEREFSTMRKI